MAEPTVVGRYQIRDRLAQGGMGVLYLALDPAIDRLVALKVLRVSEPELVERFVREARLAARLQHPNIVTVYDVGEHEGHPFIAMEYIPGETLAELIREEAPLPLGRRLSIMIDVCHGLAYAHKRGIVHRDVKPANLIVSRDSGVVKVLDFGIARGSDSNLTNVGVLIGTPNYMSPEQVRGESADHRSDIFAVGAVLYELLVYRQAFQSESPAAVLHKIATAAPAPITTIDPTIDPRLAEIVAKALAPAAADRYPDLQELATDLERVRGRLDPEARAPGARDDPAAAPRPPHSPLNPRRAAQERELGWLLERARARLGEGALDEVSDLLERAAMLGSDTADVHELRRALHRAGAERDAEQSRARQVAAALAHARRAHAQGHADAARRAVAEALALDPGHAEARGLQFALDQGPPPAPAPEPTNVALPGPAPPIAPPIAPPRPDPATEAAPPAADDADLVVHLGSPPALAHGPIDCDASLELVGRDAEIEEILGFLSRERGGAFLITGYRGVGKTSFINQVVARLGAAVAAAPDLRLVVVRQNLARPMLPVQVLYAILRGLSEELDSAGVRERLAPAVRRRLDDAVRRTSFAVTLKTGQTSEGGLGFEQAIPRGLKATLQFKRSRASSEELVYREYGDNEAEQDLIAIARQLGAGAIDTRSRWRRIVDALLRRTPRRTVCRVLFVFDELDKLEQTPAVDGRSGTASLDEIIASLKTLFTTSGITFLFVAGRDMQDRFHQDQARGDSVYESVFAHHTYLPCLWQEIERIGGVGLPNPTADPVRSFLGYLRYVSRGIPRRAVGVWTSALRLRDGRAQLRWSRPQLRRMRFFAALNEVLEPRRASQRPGLATSTHAGDADRRVLATYYLVDWMLAAGVEGFTRPEAAAAIGQLSSKIAPPANEAASLVDETLRLLVTHDYLTESSLGMSDRQLDDVLPAAVSRFKLSARRLAELGGDAAPAARDAESLPAPAGPSAIAGYTLGERIGEGSVTLVYKAVDRAGRLAAIKVLRASHARSDIARRRFEREADVLRQLRHKNIVGFLEAGEANGDLYLAMEYVPGVRLSHILSSVGRLEPDVAARIGLVAADALQHIHARGFVRNDVKPGSIIVTAEGRPCLIDFGIAKAVVEDASLTQIGSFIGTPNYAAPEVWNHQPHDARTDVYALGAMLFELVTGSTPFAASARADLRKAHLTEPATLPADAHVPEGLGRVILRCLEKRPGDRFATMVDLREALRPATDAETTDALRRLVANLQGRAAFRESATVVIAPGTAASALAAAAAASSASARPLRPDTLPPGPALRVSGGPDGAEPERIVALRAGRTLVGRAPGSDIVLDAAGVSRFHAVFVVAGGECSLEDLNSANGTIVNGVRTSGVRVLQPGDRIAVGDCVLELITGASATPVRIAAVP